MGRPAVRRRRSLPYSRAHEHRSLGGAGRVVALDRQHLVHPNMPVGATAPVVFERGEGVYLFDVDGRRYLDARSQLNCVNLGYRHPALDAAITAQLEQVAYVSLFYGFTHPQAVTAAARLAELAPGDLTAWRSRPAARRGSSRRSHWSACTGRSRPGPDDGDQPAAGLPRQHGRRDERDRDADGRAARAPRHRPRARPDRAAVSVPRRRRRARRRPTCWWPRSRRSQPAPSPRSWPSRCSASAATSRRRRATGRSFARCATPTACC